MQDQVNEAIQLAATSEVAPAEEAAGSWAIDLFHDLAGLASGVTGAEDPTILGYLIVIGVLASAGFYGVPMVLGFILRRTIKLPFKALGSMRTAAAEARLEAKQAKARQAAELREKAENLETISKNS